MTVEPGTLYITATPIGNLEDLTIRALKTLQEVDFIACEDTRHTIKLLNHYDIKNKLIAYHKFNENEKADKLIELLKEGSSVALVSDAGMPLISDPGSVLVEKLRKEDLPVTVLPGANAALSGLVLSGLDSGKFTFFGFKGKKKSKEKDFYNELINSKYTAVFYESPHELRRTLKALAMEIPDRTLSISREITKKYEETLNGTVKELYEYFMENEPRGEFVLTLSPKEDKKVEVTEDGILKKVRELKEEGLSEKEAIKKAAKVLGINKRDVYQLVKIEGKNA